MTRGLSTLRLKAYLGVDENGREAAVLRAPLEIGKHLRMCHCHA
jgi:hypothetical protein